MRVRGWSRYLECTAEKEETVFHGGGRLLPTVPENCGKPGGGGALEDSSDYFGKCPVIQRKEWVEANLA